MNTALVLPDASSSGMKIGYGGRGSPSDSAKGCSSEEQVRVACINVNEMNREEKKREIINKFQKEKLDELTVR